MYLVKLGKNINHHHPHIHKNKQATRFQSRQATAAAPFVCSLPKTSYLYSTCLLKRWRALGKMCVLVCKYYLPYGIWIARAVWLERKRNSPLNGLISVRAVPYFEPCPLHHNPPASLDLLQSMPHSASLDSPPFFGRFFLSANMLPSLLSLKRGVGGSANPNKISLCASFAYVPSCAAAAFASGLLERVFRIYYLYCFTTKSPDVFWTCLLKCPWDHLVHQTSDWS